MQGLATADTQTQLSERDVRYASAPSQLDGPELHRGLGIYDE